MESKISKPSEHKCKVCGTLYDSEEEKWGCPCEDPQPDIGDIEDYVYGPRWEPRKKNKK